MSNTSAQIHVINKCKVSRCANIDISNISFGDDIKVDSSIFVPILYNKEQLFVQFDNLMISKIESNIELKSDIIHPSYDFLSSLNDKIIAGLKGLITQLKTKHNLSKKVTYNRNYDCDEDNDKEYVLTLPFNTDNDIIKIFDSNKKRMNIAEFKLIKNMHATFIVEPYIQIQIGGDIDLQMNIHQIQIKDVKRKVYVISEYSFVDSDSETSNIITNNIKSKDKLIDHESESEDSDSEDDSDNSDYDSGYKLKDVKKLDSDSESNNYLNKYLKTKSKH